MSYQYPIPATPRVISPSPTPSETSDRQDSYFAPVTRSAAKARRQRSPQPEPIHEEKDGASSDSSLEKRARARSRSPILTAATHMNGSTSSTSGSSSKRRRMSGLTPKTPVAKSEPLPNGTVALPPSNGHLSPYDRVKKSWREFSRSPSPLGLIPLHRHYRNLIHKHEIPRKLLHVSIGFFTLRFYTGGIQTTAITPWLLGALAIVAPIDVLRHRSDRFNRLYIRMLGALMRETEVEGYNGVIWYLLGAYIALKFYPKDVGVMSILLLSWCDTAASTFGRMYGRYTVRLRRGKSLAGSMAAFATGAFVAAFFWGYLAPRTGPFPDDPVEGFMFQGHLSLPTRVKELLGWQPSQGVLGGNTALAIMSVCTGLIASFSELVDLWGWDDNLTIPLLSSAGIWAFLKLFG
ncbi:phosphatidate cytidylyltransferase [Capronia coronata CBS 617.96]|uniref:Phosphatidate cytidylyltransferase n=1 Tax=Capronia coronata CBS 617.96 TaxID=1182541 RepID=W9YDE3_9EURO|nr:phosphatidate cytidylyltransferase [Capronia coronata CBS 617.96]EXJ87700.1 phosphatidate cytidylyltransferase [Capronia coronata CBS 617.96]